MMQYRMYFLTLTGIIFLSFSAYYLFFPVKMLEGSLIPVNDWTMIFARTSGIFIGCFGLMSLLCRYDVSSTTLSSVLLTTAIMLLATNGLDIWVRVAGVSMLNMGSIMLRFFLAGGYVFFWIKSRGMN